MPPKEQSNHRFHQLILQHQSRQLTPQHRCLHRVNQRSYRRLIQHQSRQQVNQRQSRRRQVIAQQRRHQQVDRLPKLQQSAQQHVFRPATPPGDHPNRPLANQHGFQPELPLGNQSENSRPLPASVTLHPRELSSEDLALVGTVKITHLIQYWLFIFV